jgi:hypothetical protein
MDQGLTDVPLSFLSKLAESRDVMVKAEELAAQKAQESGSGMRDRALPPPNYNGGDDSVSELSSLKERFSANVLAEGQELLSAPPPHVAQQQMQSYQPQQPMMPQQQAPQVTDDYMSRMQSLQAIQAQPKPAAAAPITESAIDSSGMPEVVKQAMKKYDTTLQMPVNEVSQNIVKNTRTELMGIPETPQETYTNPQPAPQQKVRLNEQGKPVVKTSEAMIRKLVQEEMMAIMTKNIREAAIKDTIATLMKEGIIPKKRKK